MAESPLLRLPPELLNGLVRYMDLATLTAFRLTCRDVNERTFDAVARRCFTQVSTNLMGSDIGKLKGLADHERLRTYVQTIYVEDDCRKLDRVRRCSALDFSKHVEEREIQKLSDPSRIWPRTFRCFDYDDSDDDDEGIDLDALDIEHIRILLMDGKLCPQSVIFRDCRRSLSHCLAENAAVLAKSVLEDSSLSVISLCQESISSDDHRVVVQLSGPPHGREESWPMLLAAHLYFKIELSWFYTELEILDAPNLESLHLTFGLMCDVTFWNTEWLSRSTLHLKTLKVDGCGIMATHVLAAFKHSRNTLSTISLSGIAHKDTTWRYLLTHVNSEFHMLTSIKLFNLYEVSAEHAETGRHLRQITFPSFESDPLLEQCGPGISLTANTYPDRKLIVAVKYDGTEAIFVLEQAIEAMVAVPSTARIKNLCTGHLSGEA